MVMKDKLYKSHHKGLYYKTRKALVATAILLSAFTAISVPTYINIKKSLEPERKTLRVVEVAEPVVVEIKTEMKELDKDVKAISDDEKPGVTHIYKRTIKQ